MPPSIDRRAAPKGEAGLTLVEALVAVALAAVLIVGLLQGLAGTTRLAGAVEARQIASMVAQAALANFRLGEGGTRGDDAGYVWRIDTAPAAVPEPARPFDGYILSDVRVEVTGPRLGRPLVLDTQLVTAQ